MSALFVAWALGLGSDDVLAKSQSPHVVQSMSLGTDPEQLQSAVWAWLVATVSSLQFMVGVAAGLFFAESGRFLLRGIFRVFTGAAHTANFLIQHRLIVVFAGAAAGYAMVRFVI